MHNYASGPRIYEAAGLCKVHRWESVRNHEVVGIRFVTKYEEDSRLSDVGSIMILAYLWMLVEDLKRLGGELGDLIF
jgi:hypothetical protein